MSITASAAPLPDVSCALEGSAAAIAVALWPPGWSRSYDHPNNRSVAMTTLRLTYKELGERLGRSPEGARMLARRRRWRVEKGNDGKARVVVDEAELVVRPTGQPPGHDQAAPPQTTTEIEALRAQVLALTERAARAEERLAGKDALLEELRRQNDWLRLPWWKRWLG